VLEVILFKIKLGAALIIRINDTPDYSEQGRGVWTAMVESCLSNILFQNADSHTFQEHTTT
jgi:hypothetical protein